MERIHREEHHEIETDLDGPTKPIYTHEVHEEVHVEETPVVPAAQVREDVRVTETPTHRIIERFRTIVTPQYRRVIKDVEDTSAPWRTLLGRLIGLIWLFTGTVITIIGLRVILNLIGANPANGFVNLVNDVSDIFMWPFVGLTQNVVAGPGVLEVSAIIGMFVYAVLAFIFVRLLEVLFSPSNRIMSRRRTTTQQRDF